MSSDDDVQGQAANHGMYDAVCLFDAIKKWWEGSEASTKAEEVRKFEEKMIKRGRKEVLSSRQACFEAHHPKRLREDEGLLTLVSKPDGVPKGDETQLCATLWAPFRD